MLSILLFFLHILTAPIISAEFDEDELAGLYLLRAGVDAEPRCGDRLRFSVSGLNIAAENIALDNIQCSGGDMFLDPNPSSGNRDLINFFANDGDTGDFLAARLSSPILCGDKGFGADTRFVFVRPDDDIQITWRVVVGPDTPLEIATGSVYTFEEDVAYIIVDTRCLYVRADSESADSPNTVAVTVCFPSDAQVELEHVGRVPISQVHTGQRVHVGNGLYSPIFAWTHRDASLASHWYISIDVGLETDLVATPEHLVYVSGKAVSAVNVRVGDVMHGGDGERLVIRNVTSVRRKGLYNPQTLHGDIVVNGMVVSTYTTAVKRGAAHALLAPMRAAFQGLGLVGVVEPVVESMLLWAW